ncbi:MAG: hypothetical protein ABR520_01640 [Mycobacteriales bacterium]|nr:hypothetical protein [Frankia sp.]
MRSRTAALSALLTTVLALLAAIAQPAGAQYPPCRQGGASVSNSAATPGTSIIFSGDGFAPGALVEVALDTLYLKTTTADSDGSFVTRFTVPDGTAEGHHTAHGRGPRGDECRHTPSPGPRAMGRFSRVPSFVGAVGASRPQVSADMLDVTADIFVARLIVGGVGAPGAPGSSGGLGGGTVGDVGGAGGSTGGGRGTAAGSGGSRGPLARTGAAAVLPMLALGFALVVVGSVVVGTSRRRRVLTG